MKEEILQKLQKIVKELTNEEVEIELTRPTDATHGDYTTNIALRLSKQLGKNPVELAEDIAGKFEKSESIAKVEVVKPGFINFTLTPSYFVTALEKLLASPEKVGRTTSFENKKIMVEYAHPNTHKEAHIGHTRTLMTGEAISRIFEANGAKVFRANYQGDVGPHVAKAVYGIQKKLEEEGKSLDDLETYTNIEKVHFLGQAYARGNTDYEAHKEEIDGINRLIYKKGEGNKELWDIYQRTRGWSLAYYDELYQRFGVKFDRLFFETEMAEDGPRIVKEHVGDVFVQDEDGSIFFPGEKYGLHTRVFITKQGTPTYEGKEMANAFKEAEEFPFDLKVHVVGSEQEGYFQVVFKALELIDPEKFVGKQYHLPTGIIQLKGRKMSSRTGDVLTYNQLIDEVKEGVSNLFTSKELSPEEKEGAKEQVALGAIKYSVLKGGTRQNVVFDMEKSVSLQGDSGPYIQYTYVRTQSILAKIEPTDLLLSPDYTPQEEELMLLRQLVMFGDVVSHAAFSYSPNVIAEYLYELSKSFNAFYQKYRIVNAPSQLEKDFRLALTKGVGLVLKTGLGLLGIAAPDKM